MGAAVIVTAAGVKTAGISRETSSSAPLPVKRPLLLAH